MLVALILSILFSLAVGTLAARNRKAEAVIIPLLDVFQSIPILGFFPVIIAAMLALFPTDAQLGISTAVVFLIFTSMSWNITFGVYEAVKSIPQDYIDLSKMTNTGRLQRIVSIYIPASMSRIAYNTQISWAVGLFYLISSEIFSAGGPSYQVSHGIGVDIITFAANNDYTAYTYSIILLIVAVVIWQFVFLRQFSTWAEKYKFGDEPRAITRDPVMRFYSWVKHSSASRLFLLTHGRGVTQFTSSLSRFSRGLKYALFILFILLVLLELGTLIQLARQGISSIPTTSNLAGGLSWAATTEAVVALNLFVSFLRIWYVYVLVVAVAVPLGIGIALHNRLYTASVPAIEVIASIPAPALLPAIALIAAGSGEFIAAFVIFLGMIWYVLFNVMAGIRTMPADLLELKGIFRISSKQAWRNIYLPAVANAFVTGSITSVGAAWNTLIVAEYFNPTGHGTPLTQVGFGIGKVIAVSTYTGQLQVAYLAVLSMTALVVAFNLTVWRRVYHYTTKRFAYNR